MNHTALTIIVPPEIVALPNLSLAERIALAHIHEWPGSSNARLAKLLDLSERGVEQMLRRLREGGLIEQVGKGRARVHRLMFPVEHHTNCEEVESAKSHTKSGENEIVESHASCEPGAAPDPEQNVDEQAQAAAPVNPRTSSATAVEREIESAIDCAGRWDFEGALGHYRSVREIIAALPDSVPGVKVEALATVIKDETRVLAFRLVFQQARATNMPGSKLKALFATIKGLSAERLVQIRPSLDENARLGRPADITALLVGETGHRQ